MPGNFMFHMRKGRLKPYLRTDTRTRTRGHGTDAEWMRRGAGGEQRGEKGKGSRGDDAVSVYPDAAHDDAHARQVKEKEGLAQLNRSCEGRGESIIAIMIVNHPHQE